MPARTSRTVFLTLVLSVGGACWLALAPPRWWLNWTKKVDMTVPVRAGEMVVENYECRRCHQIDGRGALKAPDLAGATERLDQISLHLWLRNPKSVDGNTAMPNFHLSDDEIDAVVAYLEHLDRQR